jgi:hypothetical protein
MADKYEAVRVKLQNKLFTPYGIAAVFSRETELYDERGELLDSNSATTTEITIVPYDITKDRINQLKFGNTNEGDMFIACTWDSDIAIDDTFPFESATYRIMQIERPYLKEPVVIIAQARKNQ